VHVDSHNGGKLDRMLRAGNGWQTRSVQTIIEDMAERLAQVPGVVGVLLGGSRARGEHRPESDWDLGVYYRGGLDLAALRALAGPGVEVAAPGEWGPWVNGGAWLRIDGVAVDWILRDLDRVTGVATWTGSPECGRTAARAGTRWACSRDTHSDSGRRATRAKWRSVGCWPTRPVN
jgi:predicted nucleotidyltransferase